MLHGIFPTSAQVVEAVPLPGPECLQNSTRDATDGDNEGLGQPKEVNEVEWNSCKVYYQQHVNVC